MRVSFHNCRAADSFLEVAVDGRHATSEEMNRVAAALNDAMVQEQFELAMAGGKAKPSLATKRPKESEKPKGPASTVKQESSGESNDL